VNSTPTAPEPVVKAPTGLISFTHLQAPSVVSKTFSFGEDGKLLKTTAPLPGVGQLKVCSVSCLEELKDYLESLSPFDCLIWGLPKGLEVGETSALTTKRKQKHGGIPDRTAKTAPRDVRVSGAG